MVIDFAMKSHWQTVQLGEVLTRVKSELTIDDSVTYKQVTVRLWNKGVVLRGEQEGSAIKTKRQFYVKTGQLVMSRIDVRNGAIGLVPKELDGAIVSNDFWVYDFDESKVYPEFLALYVKTPNFLEEVNRTSSGTTHRIRAEETPFLEIQIPLPPLTEQRRIVAHIESLAARVNEAQRLREEADYETDIFINSSLNKLVSDLEQYHKTVFLEELLTDSNYGTSVKCNPERTDDAIPVLRIPNVASEKVTLNDMKYGVLSEAEFNKTVLSEGDILVVRTNGSKDLVGRCAVVPKLPEPMAFASYMIRIRSNKEIILPEFLQLVLRQQRTGGYLIDFARTTAGQYNVSLGRLKNTKIPVPPLDEQRRIVAYLDGLQAKVNALRELQSTGGEELSTLMPSVLDRAFKGEL